MTISGEEPQEHPAPLSGYGEIAPGVPRYGQYAPAGWEPPQEVKDAQEAARQQPALPPAPAYPGFGGIQGKGQASGPGTPLETVTHLAPPDRVVLATRLIMAAGTLQIIALIIWAFSMTTPAGQDLLRDAVAQAMAANPEAATAVSDQQLFITVAGFMAFIQAVCAAGYFWIAAKLRRGRTWARTTAVVLAVVSIILIPEGGTYSFYSAARIGLGIVAVFMLFRSPAKEFFLMHKAHRGSNKG